MTHSSAKSISVSLMMISFLMDGCTANKKSDENVLADAAEVIANSNKMLTRNTKIIYASLEDKLSEPSSRLKAEIWLPKAIRIEQYTSEIMRYLDSLKSVITKDVNTNPKNKRDRDVVRKLFINQGEGKLLHKRLEKLKYNLLNIDSAIKMEFADINLMGRSLDLPFVTDESFIEKYFSQTTPLGTFTLLGNFETRVKMFEYKLLLFCHEQFSRTTLGPHYYYAPVVSQSSQYIRAGEILKIVAGIGSFIQANDPKITIDGKLMDLREGSVAYYSVKVPYKAGKHKILVKMGFTDLDGNMRTIERNVEYIVTK